MTKNLYLYIHTHTHTFMLSKSTINVGDNLYNIMHKSTKPNTKMCKDATQQLKINMRILNVLKCTNKKQMQYK